MMGAAGCQSGKESLPARTATEELLLSSAADHALGDAQFSWLAGKKVFVEEKYFEGYDKGYLVGLIRERLSASGALLVKTDDKADVIVEIRSGAFSIDSSGTLVGLPSFTVPVPMAGPVQTPELSLYKSKRSDSIAKVSLFAYERGSGRYLQSAGPIEGDAHLHLYSVLFVTWHRSDVPEFGPPPKPTFSPLQPASGP
jgi:hypothetical protein